MTLYEKVIEKAIKRHGNTIAISYEKSQLTYLEFHKEVSNVAEILKMNGISKGDKVVILGSSPMNNSLILLALFYIEAIPMPIFSKTGRKKLLSLIETYITNFVISDFEISELKNFDNGFEADWNIYIYKLNNTKDMALCKVALILFTSGTTNTPKAIMLSKNNIYSNIQAISNYLNLNYKDNILLVKELSHSSSIIGELLVGLYNGCKIIFSRYFPMASYILNMLSINNISVFLLFPHY